MSITVPDPKVVTNNGRLRPRRYYTINIDMIFNDSWVRRQAILCNIHQI